MQKKFFGEKFAFVLLMALSIQTSGCTSKIKVEVCPTDAQVERVIEEGRRIIEDDDLRGRIIRDVVRACSEEIKNYCDYRLRQFGQGVQQCFEQVRSYCEETRDTLREFGSDPIRYCAEAHEDLTDGIAGWMIRQRWLDFATGANDRVRNTSGQGPGGPQCYSNWHHRSVEAAQEIRCQFCAERGATSPGCTDSTTPPGGGIPPGQVGGGS